MSTDIKLSKGQLSKILQSIQIKIRGKGAIASEKGITLFILKENKDDIIRTIKSVERLDVLFAGVSKMVKQEKIRR